MIKDKIPHLTVITVTYNNSGQIENYFRSLKKHLFPKIATQVIVVDNNSQDNTILILEDLAIHHPQLTIFRNPQNRGFSAANNQTANLAQGKYLLFLNPDTQLKDSSFLKLIQKLENDPKIGLISPALVNKRGDYQPLAYHPQTLKNAFWQFFFQKNTFSPYVPPNEQVVHALAGAALIMKKTLFDRLDGWNEKYFMYFEDLDLCDRVRKLGKKIVYCPQATLIHELGSSGKNLGQKPSRWLVQSSKKYHGLFKYCLLNLIIRSGQRWQKLKKSF